ncbi:putative serine protease EDA2 [Capsicum chinense]|nr:putative serine protease EDA2 [Capsicum chinense]
MVLLPILLRESKLMNHLPKEVLIKKSWDFEGRNRVMILPKDDVAKASGSQALSYIEYLLTGTEMVETTFLCDNAVENLQEVLAKKFGASIVTLEHQYYGKTSPFKSLTIGNLKYLSSKQALFDLTPFRNSYQGCPQSPKYMKGNVAAAVSGVAEEEDKEDDKWRIRVEEGAPHGVRVVAAPHSLKSLVPAREPVVIGDGGGGGRVDGVVKVSSLALYSVVYGELVGVEKKARVVCESCKVQCALGYYEYSKDASINLFEKCFKSGDQFQLAPVILSRKALEGGLGVSLLERAATLHDGMLPHGLQCPLLLLDTRMPYGSLSVGCEEHLDPAGTGSFYSEGEADIVVQHVFSLIYAGVPPAAIAVQSPYVAQV